MSAIEELQSAVATIAERVGPSIVGIGRGTRGSGVVIADGKVLTNAHNLRGDEVTVTFADGRRTRGKVAGCRRRRRPRGHRRRHGRARRRSSGPTARAWRSGPPCSAPAPATAAARASPSASCRRSRARSAAPAAAGSTAASSTPRRSRPGSSGGALLDADGQARRHQHQPDRRGLLPRAAGRRRAARPDRCARPRRVAEAARGSASPSRRRTSPGGCAARSACPSVTASSSAASRTAAPRRRPGSRPATSSSRPAARPSTDARRAVRGARRGRAPVRGQARARDRRADRPGRRRHDSDRRGLSHGWRRCARPARRRRTIDPDDGELLDAYSVAVSTAAERLIPSVASLRVTRQVGGWSAVAPDRRSPSRRSATS